MTRWVVRFGYDGAPFHGYARQPDQRTVEGEIRAGVLRLGLLASEREPWIEVASRTDRGVSARGNALVIDAALGGVPLLRALNGIAPEIWFRAAARPPKGFRVRQAVERRYVFFETRPIHSFRRWQQAARLFRGTVDVRSFGRGVSSVRSVPRPVHSVTVRRLPRGLRVEVRARSFVWGMVRKIVAALRSVDSGQLGLEEIRQAIRGQRRLTLPLAEPEGLVLWEVKYPIRWTVRYVRPTRHQRSHAESTAVAVRARAHVTRALWGTPGAMRSARGSANRRSRPG